MLFSNVQSIDLPLDCTAWRFWTMRQPNGCSTPAPKSSAAKQWIKELAQKNWLMGRRASFNYVSPLAHTSSYAIGCTQKPERNFNHQYISPTSLHTRILTSHIVSYYVKWSLHQRSLIKLCTQADWSLVTLTHTNNGFFKLVEALLQIHSCFFSQSVKLRGSPLSAVIASLQSLREGVQKVHCTRPR